MVKGHVKILKAMVNLIINDWLPWPDNLTKGNRPNFLQHSLLGDGIEWGSVGGAQIQELSM